MNHQSMSFAEITQTFLQYDSQKILSLDCFDTLFWRKVDKPTDIFFSLNNDVTATARAKAEEKARTKKLLHTGTNEVLLSEIYAEISSGYTDENIRTLVNHEIATEIAHGTIFDPAVNLMRMAKDKGLKIIIVSDIYFNSNQLGHILQSIAPEAFKLIDQIYCSAEHGCGKTSGLWKKIIHAEGVKAEEIFHVGDNEKADYHCPREHNINAFHFTQNEDAILDILQKRTIAAKILCPEYDNNKSLPSLFHPWYSEYARTDLTPEKNLAYTVLGPMLLSFSLHIHQQAQKNKNTKIAFLMRDGHMPQQAYSALFPQEETYSLRISRITSLRASFIDKDAIENYLIDTFQAFSDPQKSLANSSLLLNAAFKHLLLSDASKQKILSRMKKENYNITAFMQSILAKDIVDEIVKKSLAFRTRLIKHIKNVTDIQPGETLMLADLGYAGTTQNKVGYLLEEALNISVTGCYLIVAETPDWAKNRTGLITPTEFDWRTILTLTNHIASFEMLCSSNDRSVTDYDNEGNPQWEGKSNAKTTLTRIIDIQQHALDFVKSHYHTPLIASDETLAHSAAIDLARFIYFTTLDEIQIFENIKFEINIGSDKDVDFIDIVKSIDYTRKFGTLRLIEGSANDFRTNLPSELRYLSPELAISLMTSYRYTLSFPFNDNVYRTHAITVQLIHQNQVIEKTFKAQHTFDGFYSVYIPAMKLETVIMLGKLSASFELMDVSFVPDDDLLTSSEDNNSIALQYNRDYFIDGGTFDGKIIYQMPESGFIYIKQLDTPKKGTIRIVYRPLGKADM